MFFIIWLMLMVMLAILVIEVFQAEARAEFAEKSVMKLQHEVKVKSLKSRLKIQLDHRQLDHRSLFKGHNHRCVA